MAVRQAIERESTEEEKLGMAKDKKKKGKSKVNPIKSLEEPTEAKPEN